MKKIRSLPKWNIPSKAKVLYKLTRKGTDLLPLILEINIWAAKYATIPKENKDMIKAYTSDRNSFIKAAVKNIGKILNVI